MLNEAISHEQRVKLLTQEVEMEEKRIKMQQRDKKLAETLFPFKVRMGLEVPLSYTANTSLDKKVRFKESKSPKKKPTTERPVYQW